MHLCETRYEEIKEAVAGLFRYCGVRSFPIVPEDIATTLGYEVIMYSQLDPASRMQVQAVYGDAFKFDLVNGSRGTVHRIYVNDSRPQGRQRFSLLHEIGHIVLGHRQPSDVAEAEADFFAKFAIAPPSLVEIAHPADYLELAHLFDLSIECGSNSWNYYRKWARAKRENPYEEVLEKLFVIDSSKGKVLRMKKGA